MKTFSNHITNVELNVTELCTRKCWFCPRSDSKVYPNRNKHMSRGTFGDILQSLQTSNYKGSVYISGFSEPLMCKDIMYGLELLSKYYPTTLITNYDLLTVDKLKILDSFALEELKIDLYDDESQYDKLLSMLSDSNYTSANLTIKKVYSQETLEFYNRGGISTFESAAGIDTNRPCHIPFYKAMIDWNGNYLLCHSDWHRESEISKSRLNVKTTSLEQYLNSDIYRRFINKMLETQRNGLTPCAKCDIYGIKEGQLWNHDETPRSI